MSNICSTSPGVSRDFDLNFFFLSAWLIHFLDISHIFFLVSEGLEAESKFSSSGVVFLLDNTPQSCVLRSLALANIDLVSVVSVLPTCTLYYF
jgi:hypothetical protein